MLARKSPGGVALLVFTLAACILIDGWLIGDGQVDPDGDGPEAPIPTFEIAAKGRKIEIDAAPSWPPGIEASVGIVEVPPLPAAASAPPRPRPVDPAGWLGRRHFRSPT